MIFIYIFYIYGISHNIIQAIALTYKDTYAKVITPDKEIDNFHETKRVLQDVTQSPFMFVITLDNTMRQAIDERETEFGLEIIQRQGRRHPVIQLTDLSYADDITRVS